MKVAGRLRGKFRGLRLIVVLQISAKEQAVAAVRSDLVVQAHDVRIQLLGIRAGERVSAIVQKIAHRIYVRVRILIEDGEDVRIDAAETLAVGPWTSSV